MAENQTQPVRKLGFPFDGKYLRILTPKTINGIVPLIDEETNIAQFKETHAPLTARKYYEDQNDNRPKHLHHRITVVDSDEVKAPAPEEQEVLDKKKIPAKKITSPKKETDEEL